MALKPVVILALFSALVAFLATPAAASVLGIDLSAEFIKVASVRPKNPFHIVVDEQAKRKVPLAVAFDDGERHFGNNAVGFAIRKPLDTYLWSHRLLGKTIDSPQVAELQSMFGYNFVSIPGRGASVGIKMPKSDTVLSPEELVAMSLQHIRKIAKDDSGIDMKDAVITIPAWFAHKERQAVLDAADLAGVNVMALINDNTASAITYGVDRIYDNTTHTALFVDMGSAGMEATVVEYSGRKQGSGRSAKYVGQALVKASAWDATLGGAAFDRMIRDELLRQFVAKNGDKVKGVAENPRAMAKLLKQANTVKTVLSANNDIPVKIESVFKDMDLFTTFTRTQFVELAAPLLARVPGPIAAAMAEAGVTDAQLDAVVIIGGSVRVPAVQAAIKSVVKKDKLDQNINGDEAMAMGAVFRAANVSGLFQVRPFGVADVSPFPVNVSITDLAADSAVSEFKKTVAIFGRNNLLGKKKTIALSHSEDLHIALATDAALLPAGSTPEAGAYSVTGVAAMAANPAYAELVKTQKPRVSLSFVLSDSGVVSLAVAEATLEEMVSVPKPKEAKKAKKDAKKDKKDGDAADSDAEAADDKKDDAAAAAEAEADKKDEKEDAAAEGAEVEYIQQKKTHRVPLTVTPLFPAADSAVFVPLHAETKTAARAFLDSLTARDAARRALAAARNDLESLMYGVRNEADDADMVAVTTPEQRDAMLAASRATEAWLDSEASETATVEDLNKQLATLKAVVTDARTRKHEAAHRPAAVAAALAVADAASVKAQSWGLHKQWLPADDVSGVVTLAEELEAWVKEITVAQDAAKPHEAPVVMVSEIHVRAKAVTAAVARVDKKKKPAEPKAAKDANATNANATDAEGAEPAEGEAAEGAEGEAKTAPVDGEATPEDAAAAAGEAKEGEAAEAEATKAEAESKNKDEL